MGRNRRRAGTEIPARRRPGQRRGDRSGRTCGAKRLSRDRIYAKWAKARDALIDRIGPLLEEAGALAQSGQTEAAAAKCRTVLAASPNDPWALNLLAMIHRNAGELREARAAQELAVAIRPLDASIVYNLALVCRAQGDAAHALRCCDRALALAPDFLPAQRMRAALAAPAS